MSTDETTVTTVTFLGLCAFIARSDCYEVYLPSGSVIPDPACTLPTHVMGSVDDHAHLATLAIPAVDIDPDPELTSWKPDSVVWHDGVSLGCWNLAGRELRFDVETRSQPRWDATDRQNCLNFCHAAKPRTRLPARDFAIAELTGGVLACGTLRTLCVQQDHTSQPVERAVATSIVWQSPGAVLTISSAAGSIAIKQATSATISNVAPVPHDPFYRHLGFYYTLLKDEIDCGDRLSIGKSCSTNFHVRTEDTYDCVPPGTGS